MKKPKEGSIYYQIALKNKRLDKTLLKEIMRLNGMTNYSQTQFRKMFESKYTSPEVRALLIQSLYTGRKANLGGLLEEELNPLAIEQEWKVTLQANTLRGDKHFILAVSKGNKGYTRYSLNETQRNDIKFWTPIKNRRSFLTNAIMGDNVWGQRVSVLFGEYATLLGALGYMTQNYMYLNDPRGKWVFKSDEDPEDDEIEFEMKSLGVHQASTEIFMKHLKHMEGELYKYTDIMGRLGVDTTHLEGLVRTILDNAKNFYNMSVEKALSAYELDEDGIDPIDVLEDNHQAIVNLWEEARKIGMQLDNYDFNKITLKDIRYWEVIPRFVDYREDKLHVHYKQISEGVGNYFARLKLDLKPH